MSGPIFYRQRRPSRRLVWTLLAVIAVGIGLFALLRAPSAPRSDANKGAPRDKGAVPLLHVHGLGVNPADGSLYVASHSGLFVLSGHGEATRVGASFQDVMGFTVAGPDRFLASGHPDVAGIRAGQPGNLGLIESRDGGGTWTPVSLGGDADLHALAYTNGGVYAVDALTGRFMASRDLKTWEQRAELPATSIAVDPANEAHVVASTGEQVFDSSDGGHRWERLPAPAVAFLAWDSTLGLWGVSAEGQTYRRNPATGAWTERERLPGTPQAVHADGGTIYVAVHGGGDATEIHASSGGRFVRRHPGP